MKIFLILSLVAFLAALLLSIRPVAKWIARKFLYWRLRPARSVLLDEHGHGRLTSTQLHRLDASMLRRAGLVCAISILPMLFLFAPRAQADSQGYPSTTGQFTNVPTFFTNATASLVGSNTVPLHNTGLAVAEVFQGSNNVSGPITTWFYPSTDGSNFFTTPWATLVVPASGTNTVVGGTNWDQLKLRGYLAMSLVISNGTGNGVTGFGINGTVTNASTGGTNLLNSGANWNRPNM